MLNKVANSNLPRSNNMIRVPNVRVISEEGEQLGIMQTWEAVKIAKDRGMDLVEVNSKSIPPVCKIMDFGKYKYELKKKEKEMARSQKIIETKQVNVRPTTGDHDLLVKANQIQKFLSEGNKIRIIVNFKGRETAHPELGHEATQKILGFLAENSFLVEEKTEFSGKQMTTLIVSN